jgi:hypothetical protein
MTITSRLPSPLKSPTRGVEEPHAQLPGPEFHHDTGALKLEPVFLNTNSAVSLLP